MYDTFKYEFSPWSNDGIKASTIKVQLDYAWTMLPFG